MRAKEGDVDVKEEVGMRRVYTSATDSTAAPMTNATANPEYRRCD